MFEKYRFYVEAFALIKLYDYWRSSACYRLRIGFNLKGIAFESVEVNLHPDVQAHKRDEYAAINPQRRVPAIVIDGQVHTQSMAILDWMDAVTPEPAFLPPDPENRLRARAFADTVACDIHPLNNVSVLAYLKAQFGADQSAVGTWYASWIHKGFEALEVHAQASKTPFLFADQPGLAEICLIPQIYNARRFNVDLSAYGRLIEVDEKCARLEAFQRATPEAVKPD